MVQRMSRGLSFVTALAVGLGLAGPAIPSASSAAPKAAGLSTVPSRIKAVLRVIVSSPTRCFPPPAVQAGNC